ARKLVLSALTVVLTVVALGTTTFAWFTLTNTAVVQPFEAQIVADTGIEVSLDTIDWYTTLTTDLIETYIFDTYGAFRFTHVTTATGYSSFNTLGASGLTNTSAGYLEIPVHFRSNSADAIDWTAVTLTSPLSPWLSDVAFTSTTGAVTAGGSIPQDASNAMRVSVQGIVAADPAHVVVFERAATNNNNVVLGGDGVTPVDYSNGGVGNAGSYNYYYAKTGALVPGTDAVVVAPAVTLINDANAQRVLDLTADTTYGTAFYGSLTIRVWLEGWDADSYNSLLARMISASFTFIGTNVV
ncbi:MAG: hypothetical protein K9L02_02105, partial [Acholeplasmataceae bacterium]|nr:hypothetical protein [Acholeplasmataceae bacterium]